jgi:hypothetical protein
MRGDEQKQDTVAPIVGIRTPAALGRSQSRPHHRTQPKTALAISAIDTRLFASSLREVVRAIRFHSSMS